MIINIIFKNAQRLRTKKKFKQNLF